MRIFLSLLIGLFAFTVLISLRSPDRESIGVSASIAQFKLHANIFASQTIALKLAIASIDPARPSSVIYAREVLKDTRIAYKKLEYFLEYFFKTAAVFYNGPAKYEVEEPYMEYQTPIGLQVIEALLFEDDVYSMKRELKEQAEAVSSSATDIPSLLYGFSANDSQVLESTRLQLMRIMTLGISGFDAPSLKSGVEESFAALSAVAGALKPYTDKEPTHGDSVQFFLKRSLQLLASNKDFDSFNRLSFLTDHGLPLMHQLSEMITALNMDLNNTNDILNYNAVNLFSANAINIKAFPGNGRSSNNNLVILGKKLFSEKRLSGNNQVSCATCHQPGKYFTDGVQKSIAFDGHSTVSRNAPTLFYTGFQFGQFWDARAKSLEEQVVTVLNNPVEMNADTSATMKIFQADETYIPLFKKAFPEEKHLVISTGQVATALASFLRTLNPRNSPFDKYMEGNRSALTKQQVNGFNLFMGKAQCGTCHFAPLFNGLVPPLYNISELEVLGTPATEHLENPVNDEDRGRYNVFPISFYEKAFKTPTVRNVSVTGPYMHNGAFKTLKQVMDFYNKGGGKGIGLDVKNQTLSATPLNLSDREMEEVIAFLHALEDVIND